MKSLYDEVLAASRDAALVAGFEEVGLNLFTLSPQAYARYIQTERDKWGPVVRASGFRSED
ncbi:hypothetical protein D3C86_2138240 [compost metagenome]